MFEFGVVDQKGIMLAHDLLLGIHIVEIGVVVVVTMWNGPQRRGAGSPSISPRKSAEALLSRAGRIV